MKNNNIYKTIFFESLVIFSLFIVITTNIFDLNYIINKKNENNKITTLYDQTTNYLSQMEIETLKEIKTIDEISAKTNTSLIKEYKKEFLINNDNFKNKFYLAQKNLNTLQKEDNRITAINTCNKLHEEFLNQIELQIVNPTKTTKEISKYENATIFCIESIIQDLKHRTTIRQEQELKTLELYNNKKNNILITLLFSSSFIFLFSFLISKQLSQKHRNIKETKKLIKIQELYNFTHLINMSNQINDIINISTKTIIEILNTDLISISIKTIENNHKTIQPIETTTLPEFFVQKINEYFLYKMSIQKPKQIFFTKKDIEKHLPHLMETIEKFSIHSIFFMPLIVRQRIIGNYVAYYTNPNKQELTEEEIQLATSIAFHISFSLDKKEQEKKNHTLAYYDPLTNLPNKRFLNEEVKKIIAKTTKYKNNGALIYIDLDNFKKINDSMGHDVGDLLLIKVAKRLKDIVKDIGIVVRMGGDEFAVLLENIGKTTHDIVKQSHAISTQIKENISRPHEIHGKEFFITASIGISLFGNKNNSYETIMKQADIAMYQSKEAGKNTIKFYNKNLQKIIDNKFTIGQDLKNAITYNQFKLFYQPQICNNKNIISAEALIRWEHPTLGTILPMDFIPLAEENGAIEEIGEWVIKTACIQLKKIEKTHPGKTTIIAVNVSPRQFKQKNFIDNLKNIIKEIQINPKSLKIELTESTVFHNFEESISKMKTIKEMGIGISLDDFGTGYSSLSYLTKLPLTEIKIDKEFTQKLLAKENNTRTIVEAIIFLGKSLSLDIIAEGIETEEQHTELVKLGCEMFQGYLFGKPNQDIQEIKTT